MAETRTYGMARSRRTYSDEITGAVVGCGCLLVIVALVLAIALMVKALVS